MAKEKKEIGFEITQKIGVLSESPTSGWLKEINLVSWNGAAPKYDIRDWNPDHTHMGRGMTFSKEELLLLKDLLDTVEGA